jgi:hypothetical protein
MREREQRSANDSGSGHAGGLNRFAAICDLKECRRRAKREAALAGGVEGRTGGPEQKSVEVLAAGVFPGQTSQRRYREYGRGAVWA